MATAALRAAPTAGDRLEMAGFAGILAFVAALQLSIAAAQILLALTLVVWGVWLITRHQRIEVPRMFVPLAAYAAATLVSAAFSRDPHASFVDCKQLALFLLVPMVYRFARGSRAGTVLQVIISVGAASAAFGIVQYGVLEYDNLGRRPQGALGHYMTYSGLLVLVTCAAAARLLYSRDRTWPALMMPALLTALALTFTRSAWVGACVSIALLLSLKDLRLTALLPVIAALFFALAPARITDRFYSMFDRRDPTSRDRVVMLQEGARIVAAHPLTGLGPNMIERERSEYRSPAEPDPNNPHLHNVPMQIAAERGLPALGIWIWLMVTLGIDLVRQLRTSGERVIPAAGIAALAAMLAAGMFEYNFGDSEFLMLFLVLMTLPYAAARAEAA
jgi:putative inorganic carbon (hco3(-)) transporter